MKNYTNYKLLRLLLLFIVCLNFNSTIVAQDTYKRGTQISDNTAPNALEPLTFSLLDLNSKERGFLLPRMTTAERMRIPTKDLTAGMVVYNTSIDCLEFYNATRKLWMSACGEVEPADFTIPGNKCASIKVNGEYAEGVFLDSRKNVIALDVNVSSAGTFNIEAIAYDNTGKLNGYTFFGEGVFPTEGDFTVILKGNGTPKKGYPLQVNGTPTGKDKIKFLLNNVEAKCTVENVVNSKALSYDLVEVIQTGDFFTKVDVSNPKTTGKLQVKINNISQAGTVEIKTITQNGISFQGRKVLTASEVANKIATIDLIASGVPTLPLKLSYDFISNSYVRLEEGEMQKRISKIVVISTVDLSSQCNDVIIGKEFKRGDALTDENMITIPVKVIATGRGRVVGTVATDGKQTELIQYSSETIDFVFNSATSDILNVEMKPVIGTGKPTVGGKDLTMKIQLESSGAKEYDATLADEKIIKDMCDLKIPVKDTWAEITTTNIVATFYSPIKSKTYTKPNNGVIKNALAYYIPPYTVMNESGDERFYVELSGVMPKSIGKWAFETKEFNGVYFKGEGEFFQGDLNNPKTIKLKGYGTAGTDQVATVIDIYNSQFPGVSLIPQTATSRRLEIDYVYRPMVIYSIGGLESWHPGGKNDWVHSAGPRLLRTSTNFGFNGIVRIDELSFVGVKDNGGNKTDKEIGDKRDSASFKNILDSSDIVIIGGAFGNAILEKEEPQLRFLAEAVKNKKAALVYAEGDPNYMKSFVKHLSGDNLNTSPAVSTNSQVSRPFYINSDVKNDLIWGSSLAYFGKAYGGVSLTNKAIHGSSYGGGRTYVLPIVPPNYMSIATEGSIPANIGVLAFMHKEYGFVGVNNQGFMGGNIVDKNSTSTTSTSFPCVSAADGTALNSYYTHNSTNVVGYNAWFLLNLTHWAIDYNQKHNEKFKKIP